MKRIRAACLEQTVHFLPKDGTPPESVRQEVRREYTAYKLQMERNRTQYKVLEECEQPDGSLMIKIKKQNNAQPVGGYLD